MLRLPVEATIEHASRRMYSRRAQGAWGAATRRHAMVARALVMTIVCVVCCTPSPAQAPQGRQGGRGAQVQAPPQPPAADKVTPEIPGVVKAGTKIEIVTFGLRGSDAGVGT